MCGIVGVMTMRYRYAKCFFGTCWGIDVVQAELRKVLSKKTVSYLNQDANASQFQRSRSFMVGLEQASEAFRGRFRIIARGLARPHWAEPGRLADVSAKPATVCV